MKKYLYISFFFVLLAGVCIASYFLYSNNEKNHILEPTQILLTQKEIGLKVGKEYQLFYEIIPNNVENQNVVFSSSDSNIVKVNEITGKIIAKKEGLATIKVAMENYPAIYDSCIITVSKQEKKISNINLDIKNINIELGKSYQIKYKLTPSDATNYNIDYISSNDDIASVNSQGLIIAKDEGQCNIKIIDKITNISKDISVIVKNNQNKEENEEKDDTITQIELSLNNITLKEGEERQVIATLYPNISKEISWSSNDESIAIVDNNGKIIGIKKGKTTITATVDDVVSSIDVEIVEEEKKNDTKTFYAVFNESETKSCETTKKNCKVIAPSAKKSGYEFLGWSSKDNQREPSISSGDELTISKNMQYYPVFRKLITINFVTDENSTSDSNKKTCYIYNSEKSCEVIAPAIQGKNDYVALGWNINKDANVAMVKNNETILVKKDITYYAALVKKRYLTATFKVQDTLAVKESTQDVSCSLENSNSCTIKVPSVTSNNGYTVIGWNLDKKASTSTISSDSTISLNSDVIYYLITKKTAPLKANFIIQNNTAKKSNDNTSCELYNGAKSCQIVVPSLTPVSGNEIIGWNTDKDASVSNLSQGSMLTLKKNVSYYSITKSLTSLTAKFNISNSNLLSTDLTEVSCNPYNGNKSCNIVVPIINKTDDDVTVIGWSKNSSSKKADFKGGDEVSISSNTTYYSIYSQLIKVTFSVGETVSGVNIKADKLSFNYTDKNGNTVIESQGESVYRTCVSYNGEGCYIKILPTIYSKGNFTQGFSDVIGGGNKDVLGTLFKANKTYYARTGYDNKNPVGTFAVGYEKVYGNIVFEAEAGISSTFLTKSIQLLDKLYKYYPELFYYNGKLMFLKKNTYIQVLKDVHSHPSDTQGCCFRKANYNIAYYNDGGGDISYILYGMVHEMGHAFDHNYGFILNQDITDKQTFMELFNISKNLSPRPLRDYSYTKIDEFAADSFAYLMKVLLYEKEGVYPYSESGFITSDIRNQMIGYIKNKRDYLIEKGLIK